MPGGDRTGPEGRGPRTGRAAGYCSGSGVPGHANPEGRGRGFGTGRGRGYGRGWRHRSYATGLTGRDRAATAGDVDPSVRVPVVERGREFTSLLDRTHRLEEALTEIRERLDRFGAGPAD